MMHPDTELRFVGPDIGYGVFTTAPIPRGTVLWVLCRFDIVLALRKVAELPVPYRPIIERYAYIDAEGNYILCWDHARNINHSCDPSMLGVGTDFEIAVRDLAAGEHVTCEYGGLNLTGRMRCGCGAANCRGVIGGDDVLDLWRAWDARIAETLPHAARVEQPLLAFARDPGQFWNWARGGAPVPSHRAYHAGVPAGQRDVSSRPWALRVGVPGA